MAHYIISFRNGHKMKLDLINPEGFIRGLCKGAIDDPSAQHNYYVEQNIMICQTDITACHPARFEVKKEEK